MKGGAIVWESTLTTTNKEVINMSERMNSFKLIILALVAGLAIGAAFAVLPSSALSSPSSSGATAAAFDDDEPENPKAYLGPSPKLSDKWLKKFYRISGQFYTRWCYQPMYRQLMRMRKPALRGSNYGYYGDLGGDHIEMRGYGFMAKLAHAANGLARYGWPNAKPKKRNKLRTWAKKQRRYWVKRGVAIYNEGLRTDFAYIPSDFIAFSQLNDARDSYPIDVWPQPKSCFKKRR